MKQTKRYQNALKKAKVETIKRIKKELKKYNYERKNKKDNKNKFKSY
jgi:hypothetical protein